MGVCDGPLEREEAREMDLERRFGLESNAEGTIPSMSCPLMAEKVLFVPAVAISWTAVLDSSEGSETLQGSVGVAGRYEPGTEECRECR
jgi:hypothetical protein